MDNDKCSKERVLTSKNIATQRTLKMQKKAMLSEERNSCRKPSAIGTNRDFV
jgi:hypothetical protein